MQTRHIKLTEAEQELLLQTHKTASSYQLRDRCQCLLLSNQGKTITELTLIFSVSRLSITNWFKRWLDKGFSGVGNAAGQGRKFILSEQDSAIIKAKVQANCQQLKQVRSELKQVRLELKQELSKEFSLKTLQRFLKNLM